MKDISVVGQLGSCGSSKKILDSPIIGVETIVFYNRLDIGFERKKSEMIPKVFLDIVLRWGQLWRACFLGGNPQFHFGLFKFEMPNRHSVVYLNSRT